jgi:hypothetical protein
MSMSRSHVGAGDRGRQRRALTTRLVGEPRRVRFARGMHARALWHRLVAGRESIGFGMQE